MDLSNTKLSEDIIILNDVRAKARGPKAWAAHLAKLKAGKKEADKMWAEIDAERAKKAKVQGMAKKGVKVTKKTAAKTKTKANEELIEEILSELASAKRMPTSYDKEQWNKNLKSRMERLNRGKDRANQSMRNDYATALKNSKVLSNSAKYTIQQKRIEREKKAATQKKLMPNQTAGLKKENFDIDAILEDVYREKSQSDYAARVHGDKRTHRVPTTADPKKWNKRVDRKMKFLGKKQKVVYRGQANGILRDAEAKRLRGERKSKNEEIDTMLDGVIEDTTRMPRSVHPLYWTNKIGGKRLGDNPKSVASVNTAERKKLAKTYRVGRNTQVHKREVVTRKDKKEKNSRVEYLAGKNTLIAQRARKTPTIYLNKNEEIDAFLDETLRRARSSPASEWDRVLNKRKRQAGSLADKRRINIGMRKERAGELKKIRKEKNTKGIEYAQSYIQRNTADPDYAKHTKRHNSLKEIDAYLDETMKVARTIHKNHWYKQRMDWYGDGVKMDGSPMFPGNTKEDPMVIINRALRKSWAGALKQGKRDKNQLYKDAKEFLSQLRKKGK